VIVLDTNIAARLIVQDDEEQFDLARRLLDQQCFLSWTVILELGWVLDAKYKMSREDMVGAVESLMAIETVNVPREDSLRWVLDRFLAGADWADMVHIASCDTAAEAFVSFDKRLPRQAGEACPVEVRLVKA
jgi:predicted nucleic-acid-binding protein